MSNLQPRFMGESMVYGQRTAMPQNIIQKGPEIKKVSELEGKFLLTFDDLMGHRKYTSQDYSLTKI